MDAGAGADPGRRLALCNGRKLHSGPGLWGGPSEQRTEGAGPQARSAEGDSEGPSHSPCPCLHAQGNGPLGPGAGRVAQRGGGQADPGPEGAGAADRPALGGGDDGPSDSACQRGYADTVLCLQLPDRGDFYACHTLCRGAAGRDRQDPEAQGETHAFAASYGPGALGL